jgi:hypothetical protein
MFSSSLLDSGDFRVGHIPGGELGESGPANDTPGNVHRGPGYRERHD